MNTELQKLLIEILCHKEDIIDMDTCYDAEFDGFMELIHPPAAAVQLHGADFQDLKGNLRIHLHSLQ